MSTTTITNADQWIEWAAHNLASGVPDREVVAEIAKNGFSQDESAGIVRDIRDHPVFRAAARLGRESKKWALLSDALLRLESQVYDFSKVPRVSDLSMEAFHRDYYAANRPVIIEDVVSRWPAKSKWTFDFFREEFGDQIVTFQNGRSGDHRDSFVDHSVQDRLSVYLDLVLSGQSSNDYYLIAHDRLLDREPFTALLKDIIFDTRYLDPESTAGRVFFWLGPPGSRTPMHRDLGNVFLAQIHGRKQIKMAPSKQLHLMYNDVGYHSEVDFDSYNPDDYPLLKDALVSDETVGPGDLLFIPVGWWHCVKSLDVTVTVTGNNFRHDNTLRPIF